VGAPVRKLKYWKCRHYDGNTSRYQEIQFWYLSVRKCLTQQLFFDFRANFSPEWPLNFFVCTIHQVIWLSPGTLHGCTWVPARVTLGSDLCTSFNAYLKVARGPEMCTWKKKEPRSNSILFERQRMAPICADLCTSFNAKESLISRGKCSYQNTCYKWNIECHRMNLLKIPTNGTKCYSKFILFHINGTEFILL